MRIALFFGKLLISAQNKEAGASENDFYIDFYMTFLMNDFTNQ